MIGRNRVRQIQDAMTIQWANGKSEARLTPGSGRFISHVGFFAEVGRDSTFDQAMADAGVTEMEIRHPRPGAAAEIVRHWNLGETVRFFPVTSGPVAPTVAESLSARNQSATVEAGIGVRWGRGEGERSKLAIRGYLLIGDGASAVLCPGMAQFSARSRMTDELLAALIDHVRVCEIGDSLVDRAKHPEVVQCHELALPLGAGKEEAWGKGETTTVVPFVSRHPQAVDLPYLRGIWRPEAIAEQALRDWPDIQTWAHDFSYASAQPVEEQPAAEEQASPNGRVYADAL